MRVERLSFREFDSGVITSPGKAKPYLPGGRHKGEVTPPPPTFSEEQLKQAELESYRRGFLEGTEEGKRLQTDAQAETDRKISDALNNVMLSVLPIFEDYSRMAIMLREQMSAASLTIAKKVAGAALAENAGAAIQEIVERCVSAMVGEAVLTVVVHESLAASLEKRISDIIARLKSDMKVQVLPDAAIPVTDCKIQWKQGGFIRNTEQLWQDIDKAVGNMAASVAFDATKDMEKLENQVKNPEAPAESVETPTSQKE